MGGFTLPVKAWTNFCVNVWSPQSVDFSRCAPKGKWMRALFAVKITVASFSLTPIAAAKIENARTYVKYLKYTVAHIAADLVLIGC